MPTAAPSESSSPRIATISAFTSAADAFTCSRVSLPSSASDCSSTGATPSRNSLRNPLHSSATAASFIAAPPPKATDAAAAASAAAAAAWAADAPSASLTSISSRIDTMRSSFSAAAASMPRSSSALAPSSPILLSTASTASFCLDIVAARLETVLVAWARADNASGVRRRAEMGGGSAF